MARVVLLILVLVGLSGCASKFRSYNGPEVTQLVLYKERRALYLLHEDRVLRQYNVGLGFQPTGDKTVEGDGKTPEGGYLINRRNPDSRYHLSLGISYPNLADIEEANALGLSPGGDIFIHGRGPLYRIGASRDWTWGCIAVTDREMEDIYAMVKDGTPIFIRP